MTISGEQERLEIIRDILKSQSLQDQSLPLHLIAGVEDADDCAVFDIYGNLSLVVGTDFVRGTNFTLFQEGYLNFFDLGYYLVMANLSDIAAMGAQPVGLTTIIRYPDSLEDNDFVCLVRGIEEAASTYQTPIIGGDTGEYPEMVLAATAFGIAERGRYLRRQGTVEGDVLCITGTPGLPSTALAYFTNAKKAGFQLFPEEERILLNSWKRPAVRVKEGKALAQLGVVHACQDVSDGVKSTMDQLNRTRSISWTLYESSLPLDPVTAKVATFLGIDPIALAFTASVDFQLMFTVAHKDFNVVRHTLESLGCTPSVIGEATSPLEPSCLVHMDGRRSDIPGKGWNQQMKDVAEVFFGENKRLEFIQ